MSSKPTKRQEEVLDYVRRHRAQQGLPPTVREIQKHFGFASPNAAASHLRALERKKLLYRHPGTARALRVTGDHCKEVAAIPIYGDIPAGFADTREQQPDGCVYADLDSLDIRRTARTFAVRVRGDSMTGAHILDGDLVVLELREPNHGNVVAAGVVGAFAAGHAVTCDAVAAFDQEAPAVGGDDQSTREVLSFQTRRRSWLRR